MKLFGIAFSDVVQAAFQRFPQTGFERLVLAEREKTIKTQKRCQFFLKVELFGK